VTRWRLGSALSLAALLGALVIAAVTADAQQRRAPGEASHLLTVPADGAAAAALARTDARVVARYEAFTLVEAEGDDAARLRRAGADLRDDMRELRLGRSVLDPARERPSLVTKQRAPHAPGLAVVQFVGPIKDAWLDRLGKTGVRVVTYMAENGYLVSGSAEELAAVGALVRSEPAVRAAVPFTAADKLGAGVKSAGRQRLAVQTLSGGDGSPARTRVNDLGRALRGTSAVGPFRTQVVELDAAEAAALAEDPGVVSIQPSPEPELYDEIADQIVAGALSGPDPAVPTGPGYLAFHDALGLGTSTFPFVVDVTDEGIDTGATATGLSDFHEDGNLGNPSRIVYADDFTSDPDARDCGGHGTINASIIGGFNNSTDSTVEDGGGFNYGLGVAPYVQLGASKIFKCSNGNFGLVGTLTALTSSAYDKGARIANHSWGAPTGGAYVSDSQEFDALVRDAQPTTPGNQGMVEVVAAGNSGAAANTMESLGSAKNVIAVGAAESVRQSGTDGCGVTNSGADDAHDIVSFSSRGPTDDLRTKPDMVGPGTHITGSQSQATGYDGTGVCNPTFPAGSTLYNLSSGTSHSAPVVAGMAAVFREWFRQKKGGGTVVPSPALTKAVLAGAATDLDGGVGAGGHFPNFSQGWGLGNLARALDAGPRFFWDQQTTFGATGDSFEWVFAVQDPSKPVRVTLAWTDPPGPTSGNSFVNNLDLGVHAGSGAYKGNVFSGGVSVPGGTADPRNNLESVYLPGGTSGNFSVAVTAANIAGNGVPGNADGTDQDFALVVSNVAEPSPPPAQPSGLVATPGIESVALDWDDTPTATEYEVFRRDPDGNHPANPTATSTSSSFTDTGRTGGQSYCYKVRALNGVTPGPLSAEQCATAQPQPGGPSGGSLGPIIPPPERLMVDLSGMRRSVRVGRNGRFSLGFRASPGRAGSIRLRTLRAVNLPGRAKRRLVLVRRSFVVPASGQVRLALKLGRRGRLVLKRARRLRTSAVVRLGTVSARRRVTLRALPRR
jgi:hypothetical protein